MKNLSIVGRITRDAVLNTSKTGDLPVTDFNVAVNTRKATAARDENGKRIYRVETDYFKVTIWREQAKNLTQFLKKGRLVGIVGDFTMETWVDRENKVHPICHFNSPTIELLDANRTNEEPPVEASSAETAPVQETEPDELPFE